MDNLIYFLPGRVRDPRVREPDYKYFDWFNLSKVPNWPSFTVSRVNQLDTPWNLAPAVLKVPEINHNITDFDQVMDSVAEKYCKLVKESGRTPYVRWSGGIDSTAMIVSLLRVADKEVLEKLVIVCNDESIDENPYFYRTYIQGKLKTENENVLEITSENYDKLLIADGDCAEMIAGSTIAYRIIRSGHGDMLNKPWRSVTNLAELLCPDNPESVKFAIQLVIDSIAFSPVPIITVYDFFWWQYFNFKITDSVMRMAAWYTHNLTPEQSRHFMTHTVQRFYTYDIMQVWSMITVDMRGESNYIDSKYHFKKYIHDFDRNDYYFYNKHKHKSVPKVRNAPIIATSLFAIDSDWNRYSFKHREHRQKLGVILERV